MKDWKLRKQLLFGLLLSLPLTVSPLEADSSSGTSSLPLNGCAIEISRYNGPDTSRDGLRLTNFTVAGPLEPVPTTGEIEVRFGLRNDGDQAFHIGRYGIFAGARDPAGDNRDFGHWLMNQTLNPGDTVSFWAKLEVEQPGDWTFWPAYSTSAGGWGPYEWHAAEVSVFEYEIKVSGLSEGQGLHAIDAPAFRLGDAGEWSSVSFRRTCLEPICQRLRS